MDSIQAKKLQAMKNYKNSLFLTNLILHLVTALLCTLFFCSFWFPHLFYSLKHFIFVSLPNLKSFLFSPKCLFIVGNAIIVYLVRESKLTSSFSSPASDVYDKYVESSRSIHESSTNTEKTEEGKLEMSIIDKRVNKIEKKYVVQKEKGEEKVREDDGGRDHDHDNKVKEERGEEEEPGLPTEELNKRVESFIARVNRQRWLEARLVDCERG
ncbi:hypothetical protein LOK49_LG10G00089 [Camellia lanceoleosa]|uniref:Uncharacterized protein n=1 Tax=Camellia lanceoleosa TaxID=1840588 RepID=A0ACC0G6X3_9ERIC|nr:hypothetical protein LOK49_LG10G00089 [Camellia lanceoleosa]